jgi:hypothetical protein
MTAAVAVLVSLRTGTPEEMDSVRDMDISAKLTPRAIRLVVLLLAGLIGMAGFWAYYF